MASELTVYFTPEAEDQLSDTLTIIGEEYGAYAERKFKKRLVQYINACAIFPTAFPRSEKFPLFRKCVVTHLTSMYYSLMLTA